MTLVIEPLRADHIPLVRLQRQQAFLQPALTPGYCADLVAQKGVGWAALLDGQVIACAGLIECWPARAMAWSLLSDEALRHFIGIHRMTQRVLADSPWRRVEVFVDANHAAGVRWAQRLGFQYEGTHRAYTSDGRDCHCYARVKA